MINYKKIQLIHIIKKELNLSDKEYREILKNAVGVESSKELDDIKFNLLMKYFIKTKHYKKNRNSITLKQKLYIKSLIKKLQWDNEHFENFLKKYEHINNLEKCTKVKATNIIVALKNILK
ncbi:phage protein GemA/Gp16 family protein [Haliovirga abyssi]|uniref:DUF1018 domain-containing protein n=1 Tax=Haliovirga abyssi TaxID=2996794 RepID=A0AAU9DFS0_9FUSO|nr:phage protein GemA/Gp16 family protein [Haliovirga abyssi]BDU50242.1 hypothetical protein HLVA_08110 [Haliovirga abyssi]